MYKYDNSSVVRFSMPVIWVMLNSNWRTLSRKFHCFIGICLPGTRSETWFCCLSVNLSVFWLTLKSNQILRRQMLSEKFLTVLCKWFLSGQDFHRTVTYRFFRLSRLFTVDHEIVNGQARACYVLSRVTCEDNLVWQRQRQGQFKWLGLLSRWYLNWHLSKLKVGVLL